MIRIASCIVLICGIKYAGIAAANVRWHSVITCFHNKQLELKNNWFYAQVCVHSFVIDNFAHSDPDTMEQLKHIFKNLCRQESKVVRCIEPLQTTVMSCVDEGGFSVNDIRNPTFQYICKDEAQTFAGLLADPNQIKKCMQNVLEIVYDCYIRYSPKPTKLQPSCEEAKRNFDCFFKNLRRRCEVYDLLNYTEDLTRSVLESTSTCKYNNIDMRRIKLEL